MPNQTINVLVFVNKILIVTALLCFFGSFKELKILYKI